MWKVLAAGLAKSGIERTFNRAILYGPKDHMGLNLPDLHTTSIMSHIDIIIRHGGQASATGQLLQGTLEALKLEIGWECSLWNIPPKILNTLGTQSWIKHVVLEAHQNALRWTDPTDNLQLTRTHDIFLIPAFVRAGYQGQQLVRLNRCRIYLKCTTLADITTGNGQEPLDGILKGTRPKLRGHGIRTPIRALYTTGYGNCGKQPSGNLEYSTHNHDGSFNPWDNGKHTRRRMGAGTTGLYSIFTWKQTIT